MWELGLDKIETRQRGSADLKEKKKLGR